MAVNWQSWAERWERMQQSYVVQRADRFRGMLETIAGLRGEGELRLLELACRPRAFTEQALARFPHARLVAVEHDPFAIELCRRTVGSDRVQWQEVDLADAAGWEALPEGAFDAIVANTALHWYSAGALVEIYAAVFARLTEGGIFLNNDHMPSATGALRAQIQAEQKRWQDTNLAALGADSWAGYWEAARAEPTFAAILAERDRRLTRVGTGHWLPAAFHREALLTVGFREVAETWRYGDDAILVAKKQ